MYWSRKVSGVVTEESSSTGETSVSTISALSESTIPTGAGFLLRFSPYIPVQESYWTFPGHLYTSPIVILALMIMGIW